MSVTTGNERGAALAVAQRSLGDPQYTYPVWPPSTDGCPRTSNDTVAYPLEVTFDYARGVGDLFDSPLAHGLERWAPPLPPLAPRRAGWLRWWGFYQGREPQPDLEPQRSPLSGRSRFR